MKKYTKEDAIEQVKIHIEHDPDVLLNLLDKNDVVNFLIGYFDPANGSEESYQAASRFLSKAVEDCFDYLVEQEMENAPW